MSTNVGTRLSLVAGWEGSEDGEGPHGTACSSEQQQLNANIIRR